VKRDITAIRLGAREYPIRWDADSVDEVRRAIVEEDEEELSTAASGMIDHNKRVICLDPACLSTPLTAFEILMHEALHAVDVAVGLDLKEIQVEAMAFGVASMLIQSGFLRPEDYTVAGVELKGKR
jgi:hypothetical protein